jgi:hypothetical protein
MFPDSLKLQRNKEVAMVNDKRIKLPHSLGTFITEGAPENGRPVYFRLSVWGLEYLNVSNGTADINGYWSVSKLTPRFANAPQWLPRFIREKAVWGFGKYDFGRHGISSRYYMQEMASKALNAGVILPDSLIYKICEEAEKKAWEIQKQISEAFRNGLHIARTA